ncbi:hypothetical protein [Cryptosporangium sp. NPDC048952]|uniref:hypothetical protein n=1 Tax=Cryptosporangium sp. NPDC048952 TaxID=3363961 RepID=UPI003724069A
MTLHLSGSFSPNPRVAALMDGSVRIPGVEMTWRTGPAGELHERALRGGGPDVFEFSISNYLVTRERSRPEWDWQSIPVYASKATLGVNTLVHAGTGIESGADLAGRRFGVPDYTMTAGLWFRAQLNTLWNLSTHDVDWYVGRQGEQSHGVQMGFDVVPPRGVVLHRPGPGGLAAMLRDGRLDAAFPSIDIPIDARDAAVRPLFPDGGRQFMADFRAKAGFLPVNHVVLIQRRLVERHPWLPEALFEGFSAAKAFAYERDPSSRGIFRDSNADVGFQAAAYGDDPFPYGLAANREMLATAARQSTVDGLTTHEQDLASSVPESLRAT